MTKIRFFALGGLGESGKNMYVLEINDKIFVLDCGSASPIIQDYGYDSIIPNVSYLIENKDRVVGVFISHFRQKASGGFIRVAKDLKVPYYGSAFTITAIKKRYIDNMDDKKEAKKLDLRCINTWDELEFDDVIVKCFTLSSCTPDTFGYAFKVNVSDDEDKPLYKNLVYLPDFNFDQNIKGHFRIDFKSIDHIAYEGVLAMFTPSSGAPKIGHITTDGKLKLALQKVLAHKGRTYIMMDAENVSGMVQVLDAVKYQKRQATIIGSKARNTVELAMEMGYTQDYGESYITKSKLNDEIRNSEKTVVILGGEQVEEYLALERIATFTDPHYTLKPTDNVLFLVDTPKKYEKMLARSWDNIAMDNANLIEFDTKLMPETLCGAEDLKLLYSLMSPKYIIPIEGDYRMCKAQAEIASDFGFEDDRIIQIEDGDIIEFQNQTCLGVTDKIETNDILFGFEAEQDINDYVARERQSLTSEGFLVVSGMINLRERKQVGSVEMTYYGFLPEYGQDEIKDSIKAKFNEIVEYHLSMKKVDYKELRLDLKNEISKVIMKEAKKKPTLIPVIIDIS